MACDNWITMHTLLSIRDIGAGSGSRFIVETYSADGAIGCGFRTRKAMSFWIARHYPDALIVPHEEIDALRFHWFSQFAR